MRNSRIVKNKNTETGNALLGIVVIIIVLLVGGVFFWNNYQIQKKADEQLKQQAEIPQTQIIVQPEIITGTTTATSTAPTTGTSTATSSKVQ